MKKPIFIMLVVVVGSVAGRLSKQAAAKAEGARGWADSVCGDVSSPPCVTVATAAATTSRGASHE